MKEEAEEQEDAEKTEFFFIIIITYLSFDDVRALYIVTRYTYKRVRARTRTILLHSSPLYTV